MQVLCCLTTTSQSPVSSAAACPSTGLARGVTALGFKAVLTGVLSYLQDGRNPSSEWQRRASPAPRRNNRYSSVIQAGISAVIYPLSVLTSILMLNESRKIFLS